MQHPLSTEHLSLKIDVRDQTVWKCGQELKEFHSIKFELKLAGLFFKNPPDGTEQSQICIELKKQHHSEKENFYDKQLFIPTLDIFTLKASKMHSVFLRRLKQNVVRGSCNVSY